MKAPAPLPALDGLRGVAILVVMVHNLLFIAPGGDLFGRILVAIADRGWIGVQLFFALSGFLITRILIASRDATNYFSSFYARRTLRIFPLYYATLLVIFVLLPALDALPEGFIRHPQRELAKWLYLTNWVQPFHPGQGSIPHLWSLAVEEQFYLLWPLVVRWLSTAALLRSCIVLALGSLLFRVVLQWQGADFEMIYEFTPSRIDALVLGAAVACLRPSADATRTVRGTALTGWAALAVFVGGALATRGYAAHLPLTQTLGYSALSVSAACALWAIAGRAPGRSALPLLESRVLRAMGRYSYGLYLLHVPLHVLVGVPWLGPTAGWAWPQALAYLAAMLALSLAAAWASYHGFERWFLDAKRHFEPRAAQAAVVRRR